jgi:uncharacterized Zn-binding protein involved in type VI secretion
MKTIWNVPLHAAVMMLLPVAAMAESIPACALSGSQTVMIGGRPALRLKDVQNCPPDLYEIDNSISIDGSPVVHFKTGKSGKTTCLATGDQTVTMSGKQASRLGDVGCKSK